MSVWVDRVMKEVMSRARVSTEFEGAYDPTYIWGYKVITNKDEPVGVQILIPGELNQNLMNELNNLAGVYDLEYSLQPVGNYIAVWFWKKKAGEESEGD